MPSAIPSRMIKRMLSRSIMLVLYDLILAHWIAGLRNIDLLSLPLGFRYSMDVLLVKIGFFTLHCNDECLDIRMLLLNVLVEVILLRTERWKRSHKSKYSWRTFHLDEFCSLGFLYAKSWSGRNEMTSTIYRQIEWFVGVRQYARMQLWISR